MRAIDGDALEELFREVISGIAKKPEMNGNLEHMVRASAMVIEMIQDAPTIEPEPHWIPCDKGEPNEDMECWVTVKTTDALYRGNFTRRYGERRDKGFITSGGFMWWNTALAWMPIYEPEPYKEGES